MEAGQGPEVPAPPQGGAQVDATAPPEPFQQAAPSPTTFPTVAPPIQLQSSPNVPPGTAPPNPAMQSSTPDYVPVAPASLGAVQAPPVVSIPRPTQQLLPQRPQTQQVYQPAARPPPPAVPVRPAVRPAAPGQVTQPQVAINQPQGALNQPQAALNTPPGILNQPQTILSQPQVGLSQQNRPGSAGARPPIVPQAGSMQQGQQPAQAGLQTTAPRPPASPSTISSLQNLPKLNVPQLSSQQQQPSNSPRMQNSPAGRGTQQMGNASLGSPRGLQTQQARPVVQQGMGRGAVMMTPGAAAAATVPPHMRPVMMQRTTSNPQMLARTNSTQPGVQVGGLQRANSGSQLSPSARPVGQQYNLHQSAAATNYSAQPGTPSSRPPFGTAAPTASVSGQAAPGGVFGKPASAPSPLQHNVSRPAGGGFGGGRQGDGKLVEKTRLQELVKQVAPNEKLDPDVEEELLNLADDFIESVTTFACALARHRKAAAEGDKKGEVMLEAKDVLLHLERNWQMSIPGFSGDELRPYRRMPSVEGHKQRVNLVRKSQHSANPHDAANARGAASAGAGPSSQQGPAVGTSGGAGPSGGGAPGATIATQKLKGPSSGPTPKLAPGEHVSFKMQGPPPQKVAKTSHAFEGT